MKITYNIYDAHGHLPEPSWIFHCVRRVDYLMRTDPNKNWTTVRRWARPMCQLRAGLFLNITDSKREEIEKAIDWEGEKSDDLRLELSWVDRGYVRICFDVEGRRDDSE